MSLADIKEFHIGDWEYFRARGELPANALCGQRVTGDNGHAFGWALSKITCVECLKIHSDANVRTGS